MTHHQLKVIEQPEGGSEADAPEDAL